MKPQAHVIKIGGSLLSRPGIEASLQRWLKEQTARGNDRHLVLIVGGGHAVEQLRQQYRNGLLGEAQSHWNAIEAMDANVQQVSRWLTSTEITSNWGQLQQRLGTSGATLFKTGRFLRDIEPKAAGRRLPISWSVTSDSIAARIAILLGARLSLLKSQKFDEPVDRDAWRRAAAAGIVDDFFPTLVEEVVEVSLTTLGQQP